MGAPTVGGGVENSKIQNTESRIEAQTGKMDQNTESRILRGGLSSGWETQRVE